MQILKKGQIPKEIEMFSVTCPECKTRFKFTERECQWYSWNDLMIKCPFCGNEVEKRVKG